MNWDWKNFIKWWFYCSIALLFLGGTKLVGKFFLIGIIVIILAATIPASIISFLEISSLQSKNLSGGTNLQHQIPQTNSDKEYCNRCGKRLLKDAKTCKHCGYAVSNSENNEDSQLQSQS
jgi:ribosomal protein L37E